MYTLGASFAKTFPVIWSRRFPLLSPATATIGVYLPTRPKPSQEDLEALRVAGEKMQELIASAGTTEDELVEDFKQLRREKRMPKG
jgi:hypothetical protein